MEKRFGTIQRCAFGFAALFLGVYALDYVPGIMDQNGLMFGLFHMSKLIDFGHLALGALALISAFISARAARIYFWVLGLWYTIDVVTYFVGHLHEVSLKTNILVNLPHTIIFIAAYWIAMNVGKSHGPRRFEKRASSHRSYCLRSGGCVVGGDCFRDWDRLAV